MATLQGTETEDGEEILSNGGPGQRTLCLIGNASEYTSHTRRTNILEAINPSWSSCAAEKFSGAKDSIFGEAFQADLTERVEKDTALAKAVSITRKSKRRNATTSLPQEATQEMTAFFLLLGASCQVLRQAGQECHSVQLVLSHMQGRNRPEEVLAVYQRGLEIPEPVPRTKIPPKPSNSAEGKTPPGEVLRLLQSLPQSEFGSLGMYTGADLPVGGGLSHYYENWHQVSRGPWVLETVQGYRLELHSQPPKNLPIFPFGQQQSEGLTRAMRELVDKGVIQPVWNQRGGFFQLHVCDSQGKGLIVSSDQSRSANTYLVPHHFKMEGIRVVKSLIQKGNWIGKLDLKDDFLSVPIHSTHRRYPFQWEEQAGNFRPCHSV